MMPRALKGTAIVLTLTALTLHIHRVPRARAGAWVLPKADMGAYEGGYSCPSSDKKYCVPSLNSDQVWVSSIPAAGSVYLVSEDAFEELFSGRTHSPEKHLAFLHSEETKQKYLKCSTPCLLSIAPGPHVLAVEIEGEAAEVPGEMVSDGSYQSNGEGAYERTTYKNGKVDKVESVRARSVRWYFIDKKNSAGTLTALFYRKGASLDSVSALYPAGVNFVFDDATLTDELSKEGVSASEVGKAVGLLHRGGRIAVEGESGAIMVQIVGDNRWKVVRGRHGERE